MKILVNEDKLNSSCYDYAFNKAFFKNSKDEIIIQNIDKKYEDDSLLNFFYGASNKHKNFERTKLFFSAMCKEETSIQDIVSFCKKIIYPLIEEDRISTTILGLTEGWNLVILFDDPLLFIRMNEDIKQVLIAFSGESTDKDWNSFLSRDNFFNLLKSRIIEELLNVKIFR